MTHPTPASKVCRGCGQDKPAAEFHRRASGALRARCKPCVKAQYAAKRIPTPLFKACLGCEETKPAADYARHPDRPDGLQAYCRPCTREKNAASLAKNMARPEIVIPERKTCGSCREELPGSEFFRDARRSDGLYANCKRCHIRLTTGWKDRHPDAVRRIALASYLRNADKRRAASRAYRRAHLDECRARSAAWKRANRARATAIETTRRARKANAPGDATPEQIAARWRFYGDRCWMCGDEATATDHVRPLAAGGSHWPANLRPACAHCNGVKNDLWPLAELPARLAEARARRAT